MEAVGIVTLRIKQEQLSDRAFKIIRKTQLA